jgi:hypothetical protein
MPTASLDGENADPLDRIQRAWTARKWALKRLTIIDVHSFERWIGPGSFKVSHFWIELRHCELFDVPSQVKKSSGDTIPNCLGEFREIKERTGITAIAIRQVCPNKLGLSALATRERSTGERRRVERNK